MLPNGFGKTQAGHATLVRDEAQQPAQVTRACRTSRRNPVRTCGSLAGSNTNRR